MLVLAIFPCLYFLPLSFSFSENLVKKLKLQIIDTCMYAHIQKYQITAAYRPVMAYRVCFFAACFISLHNLLPLTLPLDIPKSTVSKVSAEQNIKEHKVTKFRSHFTCRDKVQNDIFSEGCLNNQKLTHRVSTWHKNLWYQLIWQPMDRSRCEQRLSVKALQNIPSLREIYSQRDTSSMSLIKGQRKPWTVEFWDVEQPIKLVEVCICCFYHCGKSWSMKRIFRCPVARWLFKTRPNSFSTFQQMSRVFDM